MNIFTESEETKDLSNTELQRLVLLEQLKYFRAKNARMCQDICGTPSLSKPSCITPMNYVNYSANPMYSPSMIQLMQDPMYEDMGQ
jgi:hypothetical protein